MSVIRVAPELWATSLLPEGILQSWLRPDGALVKAGEAVACVRVEDALHELMAPHAGRLKAECRAGSVIEPGAVIGRVINS